MRILGDIIIWLLVGELVISFVKMIFESMFPDFNDRVAKHKANPEQETDHDTGDLYQSIRQVTYEGGRFETFLARLFVKLTVRR